VKVLFFAKSRELADCSEASVQMPSQLSGRDLHSHIIANYPRYAFTQLISLHFLESFLVNFSFDDHDRCEFGECFFWYWLTWVVPDKIYRAVKQLRVCVIAYFL